MKNHDAKFTFYYLLSLVALIFVAISAGIILFNIVDNFFPDTLRPYSNMASLRFAISSLIVASPVYFLMLKLINKGIKNNELSKESTIRKWLSYLILFVSSIVILSSLISSLNNFLSGELTIRFALQVLSVFIIALLIFLYYLYDIKNFNDKIRIFKYIGFSFLIILLISSFLLIESPQKARMRKVDQQTMIDINNLESLINNYYVANSKLPENIEELDFNRLAISNNTEIEYHKIDNANFELCAYFNLDSENIYKIDRVYTAGRNDYTAGRNCFEGMLWVKEISR